MFIQPVPVLRRDRDRVVILDQTALPFRSRFLTLSDVNAVAHAIRSMQVRGAPLIGATAAYGVALAMTRSQASDGELDAALALLAATRPTAVNLHWALARQEDCLRPLPASARAEMAWAEADAICTEDAATCAAIGEHGRQLFARLAASSKRPLRVMTHCNAGWVATCGAGTALAPVYAAHQAGIAIEVLVSETRPRNQGLLTAWELAQAKVPYQLIADNAAGLLLQRGEVDVVITGADRIAANGDSANKVGTYLKALAARAHDVPFYIAAPHSTLDFACGSGAEIVIEDRGSEELFVLHGLDASGAPAQLRQAAAGTPALNPAFDVTPASLISAIITERGCIAPAALQATYASAP